MLGIGKRYRVVLRDDNGIRAWSPQTRAQALAAFGQRVVAGRFSPLGGSQLMVLSQEEWERLGRPGDAGGGDDLVGVPSGGGSDGAPRQGGPRRMFRWLSSSRSK
jgi:hypothetical protein